MIFLDNASTTRMFPEVAEIVNRFNTELFYNPSALYTRSLEIQNTISSARKNMLKMLGGSVFDNIIFTSCATESNNMVLRSCARSKSNRILISVAEHPAVYNMAMELKNSGYIVEFIGLKQDGTIDENELKNRLGNDVCLVSIMHVNNETGAINDIKSIAKMVKSVNKNILLHCDGVQAFGKIKVNVAELGVDFYTISAHKLHGPKGVGALYVKNGINLKPFILGGGQQNGLRSGTENVSGILGFEKACEIAVGKIDENYAHVKKLKQILLDNVKDCEIVAKDTSSPYITMLLYSGVRSETILHMLEDKGYLVGTGSACSSKKKDNRILTAIGYSQRFIEGSIRVSFSCENTVEEVQKFVLDLNETVEEYRKKVMVKNNGKNYLA